MTSFGRALLSQLHFRMLLLTIWPFLLSLLLWGVVLWLGLQPMIDWLHAWFADNNLFQSAASVLGWFGLGAVKTVLVPLIAMWLLLPLMVVTALVFVGMIAMPAVVRHVSNRHYPQLARLRGGSLAGSLSMSLGSFLIFAVMWLVTLPLNAVPLLAFVVQPALWGWLTYRVMAYDALADHASAEERRVLMRTHRWPLLAIGIAAGAMGAAPTLLWLGGALSVILFPLLAGVSIWLYVLVFVFSGLWFQHYLLEALQRQRLLPAAVHAELPARR
ncbi:MAG: hypothetical protein JWM30_205, partial [Burkholderia sp.]|nr:hypothetical protein [Burkholderia sp.]